MATVIERVKLEESSTRYNPLRGELFDKCRERLGYDADDKAARASARINAAMKAVGIDPLSLKQVARYKNLKAARANRVVLRACGHGCYFIMINLVMWYSGWCSFFVGKSGTTLDKMDMGLGVLFGLAINLVVGVAVGAGLFWGFGGDWKWERSDLEGYSRPVPEFALSYALALQAVEPQAKFKIEELIYEDEVADPFLIFQLEGREAYIAVWDEPKFEGRAVA